MRNFSKCCNSRLIVMKQVDCVYCSRCGLVYHKIEKSPTGNRIIEEPDEWE